MAIAKAPLVVFPILLAFLAFVYVGAPLWFPQANLKEKVGSTMFY